jgi:hypothetical protein
MEAANMICWYSNQLSADFLYILPTYFQGYLLISNKHYSGINLEHMFKT